MDYLNARNQFVKDDAGRQFAYRELGQGAGLPLVMLNHLSATLDNWDPALIEQLGQKRRVIVFDNRGIGLSDGQVPDSIEQMADDVMAFISAMQFPQIDLLGLSMGGFVAQDFVLKYPSVVHRLILVGTGPKGDKEIAKVGRTTNFDILRAAFTRIDVKQYLFFTKTPTGKQAGRDFIKRLRSRNAVTDKTITLAGYRKQMKAIKRYAKASAANFNALAVPTLIVNGDHDRMVPTQGSYVLHDRIKPSTLKIYEDAGHMSLFQYTKSFTDLVDDFLK